jgi:hypothetical protein
MLTIHKFTLNRGGTTTVEVPAGSRLLKLALQNDTATLWFLVNPTSPKVVRRFNGYVTGVDIEYPIRDQSNLSYVDSVLFRNGDHVVHYFEIV